MDKIILKRILIIGIVFLFLSTSCFPFVTSSYNVDHEPDLIIEDIFIDYTKTGGYLSTQVKDIGNPWDEVSSDIEIHVKIYRFLFGIPLIPVRSYTVWTYITYTKDIEPRFQVVLKGLYRICLTVNPNRLIEESNFDNNKYYEDFQRSYGNWYIINEK
ncbi:MAG: hypothetical protein BV456_02375 [Thermoplasmata archaeon M8B2D]|nr:MAG: hypothetical protein BV456_02375 [Thermoplasmata archaeon M8B2D]